MQIGMVGLGRMGANMSLRLLRGGREVIVYDRDPKARFRSRQDESFGAKLIAALPQEFGGHRVKSE